MNDEDSIVLCKKINILYILDVESYEPRTHIGTNHFE